MTAHVFGDVIWKNLNCVPEQECRPYAPSSMMSHTSRLQHTATSLSSARSVGRLYTTVAWSSGMPVQLPRLRFLMHANFAYTQI